MKKIDIIWNITRVCYYNCKFCAVDAYYISKKNEDIFIKKNGLTEIDTINFDHKNTKLNICEKAVKHLQNKKEELTLEEKIILIENIAKCHSQIKLDFSGGDPLLVKENYVIIEKAKKYFGKDNITISTTGLGLNYASLNFLENNIGEINFTYDNFNDDTTSLRPKTYAKSNLIKIKELIKKGLIVRAEFPLIRDKTNENFLEKLYLNLHKAGVHKLLLMRYFPVGRGCNDILPTMEDYIFTYEILKKLENKYKNPKIKLQCALKNLIFQNPKFNPCDAGILSFGLTHKGILLFSPWAYTKSGNPMNDWILGDLKKETMNDILQSKKYLDFVTMSDENFGHCKIHAYLNSKERTANNMFSQNDPFLKKELLIC